MNLLMAYPAIESFALSSLGYMHLHKIAENTEGINITRISTDSCNIKKSNFDAVSFSLSFDFDFMGVFNILQELNIPFYKNERDKNSPLIFAGGPVITTNPRPYEQFFDFMIIGDGESLFKEVLDILKNNNKDKCMSKLKNIDGIYIPGKITNKKTDNLNNVIYSPIVSEKSYFKNTFIIEIARGCMNRCAFCTASYINLPFRNYEYNNIIQAIEYGLTKTNKIALLGAQISAHPHFNDIMQYIEHKIKSGTPIELKISSLRTDSINPQTVKTLVLGGQKHSTIAIEAASERLRKLINKNLTEEQIINAINIAMGNGLKGLKIYSMIGIPTENENDIKEFITLAKKIKNQTKGFNIEFSFSSFVPKPHTPFQWEKREDTKSLEKKQLYLTKELSKLGVQSKFSSFKWDFWQTVLSRSGPEIAPLLVYVYKNGGKIGTYKSGMKHLKIDIQKSIDGFNFDEELPWDCIIIPPGKKLLLNEYNRLFKKI